MCHEFVRPNCRYYNIPFVVMTGSSHAVTSKTAAPEFKLSWIRRSGERRSIASSVRDQQDKRPAPIREQARDDVYAEKQSEAGSKQGPELVHSKHYSWSCSPGQGVVTANNPRSDRGLSTLGTLRFWLQFHAQVAVE